MAKLPQASPLKYFVLVFALSIPFWIFGAFANSLSALLPINLPVSAAMFVCPILAALILTYQEKRSEGLRALLRRAFDDSNIKNKAGYIPIILFMPVVMIFSYGLMRLLQMPLPEPDIQFGAIPVFFILFFIGAICEEIGWTGYATDPLQARWSALTTSLILGGIWALWHVIPWFQGHPNLEWVAWQCANTVAMRIVMVWLYNNTGKSVFSAILFHTMINVSVYMFPNYGSHFNPMIAFIITAIAVMGILFLYGPKTLTQYRYNRP